MDRTRRSRPGAVVAATLAVVASGAVVANGTALAATPARPAAALPATPAASPAAAPAVVRPKVTVALKNLTPTGVGIVYASVQITPRYRGKKLTAGISGTGAARACASIVFKEKKATHTLTCVVRGLRQGSTASFRVVVRSGRTTVVTAVKSLKVALPKAAPVVASRLLGAASLLPAPTPGAGVPCSLAAGVRTCELWAVAGTLNPGAGTGISSFPVWVFNRENDTTSLTGRQILVARAGETLRIRLHNNLPQPAGGTNPLSVEVPGLPEPAQAPITLGAVQTYDFGKLATAGSFVYQAGQTAMASRQIAMGLSGLLVVRPANYSATTAQFRTLLGAGTAQPGPFDQEAAALVNEFDPAFNRSMPNGQPWTGDLSAYRPTVVVMNGRVFNPAAAVTAGNGAVFANAGERLLLRHADLGLRDRSISISDGRFSQLTSDGRPLVQLSADGALSEPAPRDVGALYLNPGQTADTITTIPSDAQGRLLAVADASAANGTGTRAGLGGAMMVVGVNGLAGATASATTSVTATPNQLREVPQIAVRATFAGAVSAVEYSIDGPAANGAGTPVAGSGTSVTFSIPMADFLAAIDPNTHPNARTVPGEHLIWVHGYSAAGWGTYAADVVNFQPDGPVAASLAVSPSVAGAAIPGVPSSEFGIDASALVRGDVIVTGTGVASLTGWKIWDAQWCLSDTAPAGQAACEPGHGGALTMAPAGPSDTDSVVAFAGVVPKALTDALAEGSHPVWVRLLEGPDGSAGAPVPPWSLWDNPARTSRVDIVVDRTAPSATALSIEPTPNNGNQGTIGNLGFLDSVAVEATLTDPDLASTPVAPGSGVALGEVFVDEQPTADQYGTGQELTPLDGAWDSSVELTRALVPLAVLRALPDGPVNVYVHGKDRAGNWGPLTPVVITLDRGVPVVGNLATSAGRVVTFDAADPGAVASPIVAAEWFDATADPGAGSGTAIPVPVPANPLAGITATTTGTGTLTIGVRVKDAAGNWSAVATVQVSA